MFSRAVPDLIEMPCRLDALWHNDNTSTIEHQYLEWTDAEAKVAQDERRNAAGQMKTGHVCAVAAAAAEAAAIGAQLG